MTPPTDEPDEADLDDAPREPTGDLLLDCLREVGIWPAEKDPWAWEDDPALPPGFEEATAALIQRIRTAPSWFEVFADMTTTVGQFGLNDPVIGTCAHDEFADLPGTDGYPWHKRGPLWYSSRLTINARYDGPVLFLRDGWVGIDPDDDEAFTILSWDDFLGHRLARGGSALLLGDAGFHQPKVILTHAEGCPWSTASLAVAAAVLSRLQPVAEASVGEMALRHPMIEPWSTARLTELLGPSGGASI